MLPDATTSVLLGVDVAFFSGLKVKLVDADPGVPLNANDGPCELAAAGALKL